jgi:hypothetical protein
VDDTGERPDGLRPLDGLACSGVRPIEVALEIERVRESGQRPDGHVADAVPADLGRTAAVRDRGAHVTVHPCRPHDAGEELVVRLPPFRLLLGHLQRDAQVAATLERPVEEPGRERGGGRQLRPLP